MNILLVLAILPVIALCWFIYHKDRNKEPKGLLALIFGLGLISVIPIAICELVFQSFLPVQSGGGFENFIPTFIAVLLGVALFEEGFKWLITKFLGYNNKEFDEVYDVIVYSVFASLGFACFENVMYVMQYGVINAFSRAFNSIPGHTCFAIAMGYFFAKAKVGQINGNHNIYVKNTILSIVVPMILHTFYDAFLFVINAQTLEGQIIQSIPFTIFYVFMVVVCFITIDKTAKVQDNLSTNLSNGNIARNEQGVLYYTYQNVPVPAVPVSNVGVATAPSVSVPVPNAVAPAPVVNQQPVVAQKELSYCPICGRLAKGLNFCGGCGFKLK